MRFKFFPNVQPFDPSKSNPKDEVGDVGKEIKELSKHRSDLFLRVKSFLNVLSNVLLCAELKHKKEPMKLDTAFAKLKQYRELVKKGIMQ